MDELGNLSAFLKVLEKGSLTAAATALNCSTSTVSKRIKQLEHTVGAMLLSRSTHGVARPTEVGREYYERVHLIVQELQNAKEGVRRNLTTLEGVLRLHLTPGTGVFVTLPAILKFIKTYPSLNVEISVLSDARDVLNRGFDVSIQSKRQDAEELSFTSINARELVRASYLIYAAPSYLAIHGVPAEPADLANHNCLIAIRQPSPYRWWFRKELSRFAVNVRGSLESDNWMVIHEAVKAGIGIARMLRLNPAIDPGAGLRTVLDDHVMSDISIWALTPRMQSTPRKVDVFLNFLTDELARIASGDAVSA